MVSGCFTTLLSCRHNKSFFWIISNPVPKTLQLYTVDGDPTKIISSCDSHDNNSKLHRQHRGCATWSGVKLSFVGGWWHLEKRSRRRVRSHLDNLDNSGDGGGGVMKYLSPLFACCDLITGLEFPYKFIAVIKAMGIQAEIEVPNATQRLKSCGWVLGRRWGWRLRCPPYLARAFAN